jgi:hypothetical protein
MFVVTEADAAAIRDVLSGRASCRPPVRDEDPVAPETVQNLGVLWDDPAC